MAILDNDVLLDILQDPEDIPEKVCSPREGNWETDLTEALVEISEKILDDDQKSIELLIGTGWEEVVCGWGPVSAMACRHPVKKPKKLNRVENADCVLCLDLCSVPDNKDGTSSETKATIHTNHKEMPEAEQRLASTIPVGEDLPYGFTDHCPSTAMVSTTETHCDTVNLVSPGEQRQNKDKSAQRISSPFTSKVIPICTNCYNANEFPISSSPMLLPPLKVAAGIGHSEHMARRRDFLMQQLEKLPSKGFVEGSLNGHLLTNTDLRAERRLLEALSQLPQEQLKVPEQLSFITPCVPKTPIKEFDRFQWSSAPIEQKLNGTNGHLSIKQNINPSPMGFLHTRTIQNKCNMHQGVRPLNDARYRRAKSDTTSVLRNTRLPSLIVTRVDIPPRIKMC
ncbi:PREDICTED: uncharacterized protein C16orf46 homolog [Nanorana parkeri]|uniref:uncharacterized protein C16orf46 homolog n=1 Tax=Nanorana parkeri TaxID=125878 RepID=UPI000854041C|nr:PREDICTED: uncharacterized protein C16orf46 homolog [Nanorana parkeri]